MAVALVDGCSVFCQLTYVASFRCQYSCPVKTKTAANNIHCLVCDLILNAAAFIVIGMRGGDVMKLNLVINRRGYIYCCREKRLICNLLKFSINVLRIDLFSLSSQKTLSAV